MPTSYKTGIVGRVGIGMVNLCACSHSRACSSKSQPAESPSLSDRLMQLCLGAVQPNLGDFIQPLNLMPEELVELCRAPQDERQTPPRGTAHGLLRRWHAARSAVRSAGGGLGLRRLGYWDRRGIIVVSARLLVGLAVAVVV